MKLVILLLALIFTAGCLQGQREGDLATNLAMTLTEQELGEAVKEGDLQKVRSMMAENSSYDLDRKIPVKKEGGGSAYLTPLQIGAAWGRDSIVAYLLDSCKVDIDAKTGSGRTSLHLAAENDHDKVAKILIDNGANKDVQDRKGTPLHRAAICNNKRMVMYLIEEGGVDITIRNQGGKTALELAQEKGHEEIIELIKRYEIRARMRQELGDDEFERIKSILEQANYRANNPVNDQGHNLLYHAAEKGWEKVAKLLVETEEENNLKNAIYQDNHSLSPLYIAVQEGNTEIVKLLIYGRAASNHRRLANQEEEIEREAVRDREAAVRNLKDQEGRTLLHVAAIKGYERIVRLLVEFMAIAAEEFENSQAKPIDQGHVLRELAYVSQGDNYGTTAESLARDARVASFLEKIKKNIEKRRKNLDKAAHVLSGHGGGITFGIIPGGTAALQYNRAYQTQEWAHERRGLIVKTRKIWRHQGNRLWQGNDPEEPARRCCCF